MKMKALIGFKFFFIFMVLGVLLLMLFKDIAVSDAYVNVEKAKETLSTLNYLEMEKKTLEAGAALFAAKASYDIGVEGGVTEDTMDKLGNRDRYNGITIWDEYFPTEEDAIKELQKAIKTEFEGFEGASAPVIQGKYVGMTFGRAEINVTIPTKDYTLVNYFNVSGNVSTEITRDIKRKDIKFSAEHLGGFVNITVSSRYFKMFKSGRNFIESGEARSRLENTLGIVKTYGSITTISSSCYKTIDNDIYDTCAADGKTAKCDNSYGHSADTITVQQVLHDTDFYSLDNKVGDIWAKPVNTYISGVDAELVVKKETYIATIVDDTETIQNCWYTAKCKYQELDDCCYLDENGECQGCLVDKEDSKLCSIPISSAVEPIRTRNMEFNFFIDLKTIYESLDDETIVPSDSRKIINGVSLPFKNLELYYILHSCSRINNDGTKTHEFKASSSKCFPGVPEDYKIENTY